MAKYIDKDAAFGLNSFGKAKITDESQTLINNLITILMAKPGNFPSQPDLGMDILQYLYTDTVKFNPDKVKATLVAQCPDFKACVEDGTFDITYKTDPKTGQAYLLVGLPVKTASNERLLTGIFIDEEERQIFRFAYSADGDDLNEINFV